MDQYDGWRMMDHYDGCRMRDNYDGCRMMDHYDGCRTISIGQDIILSLFRNSAISLF